MRKFLTALVALLPLLNPVPTLAGATVGDLPKFLDTTGGNLGDSNIAASSLSNVLSLGQFSVPDNATLMGTSTAVITTAGMGVIRADYVQGNGAPPLLYLPSNAACSLNAGAGDNGSQVKSADNKCWLAQFPTIIDVREFGATSTGDATAKAQAMFDFGFNKSQYILSIPIKLNFTKLSLYYGEHLECGGPTQTLTRTAVGPGLYTNDAPGHDFPHAFNSASPGPTLAHCHVESGGLAGSGITIARTAARLYDVVSTGTDTSDVGSAYIVGSVTGNQLTVSTTPVGTIRIGQMLVCHGCGYPNVTGNTYDTIASGNASPYTLTSSFVNPFPSSGNIGIALVTPWSWSDASTQWGGGANGVFPSSNITFLGDGGDADSVGTMAGEGPFVGGTCTGGGGGAAVRSGIGYYFDTPDRGGANKFNADVHINANSWCTIVDTLDANGSDNVWMQGEMQNAIIGMIFATGAGNAFRNQVYLRYYEPGSDVAGSVAFAFGQLGRDNYIHGVGSLASSTFSPVVLDFACGLNATGTCGSDNALEVASGNTVKWLSSPPIWTFSQLTDLNSLNNGGGNRNPGGLNADLWMFDADDVHHGEMVVSTYQSGNIPFFDGWHQRNPRGSPLAVSANDILAGFGGRGQYDTTQEHLCNTGTGGATIPCAYMAVVADQNFTASAWGTRFDFYLTPDGTTALQKVFQLLNDGSARTLPQVFSKYAACSAGNEGAMAAITDSTTATNGATITGGGAHHVLGYCNASNWIVLAGT